LAGCTGGAAGSPKDDLTDLIVVSQSPGNGQELNMVDSTDGFNALNNPTLTNPSSVTIVFSTSLDPTSVINTDPRDPQGSRNVRLFFFDVDQGAFDPQNTDPTNEPPGANVLIEADTILSFTNQPNDTIIIRPTGITPNNPFSPANPMPDGQYSVIVERGVKAADGTPMRSAEYFFFFRVGQDTQPPVVVETSPANGQKNVDPTSPIRITLSETALASTVNVNTLGVTYQPTGVANPIVIPGTWFTDGGNGPGNNFPDLQLDSAGNPGFSGQSPRNGVDLVFLPDLTAFPVNMTAEDPNDGGNPGATPPVPGCTQFSEPPQKGNRGYPLGQSVTVAFNLVGLGVTDTAGLGISTNSPNLSFTFETLDRPDAIFAPGTRGAIYFGDPVGVGVIDVNPSRTPYLVGPNPPRANNSVVTIGAGQAAQVVRVPVSDLKDIKTDTRPYTAFYSFVCSRTPPSIYHTMTYALSGSAGGGEVIAIDSFMMTPLGRWSTPSPGGIGITALSGSATLARAAVSNFSANTVTVYDIGRLGWFDLSANNGGLVLGNQAGFASVNPTLILNQDDFETVFPSQTGNPFNTQPGPPIIGTVSVGISPTSTELTHFPNTFGSPFLCGAPLYTQNTILGVLNAGESTVDFTELTNLGGTSIITPDLDGVSLSSPPKDMEWTPVSLRTGAYYCFISAVGGTVELFATGFSSNQPTVRGPTTNFAPNKIVNNIGGFQQPNGIQWITNGNSVGTSNGYTAAALIAETGENRLQQVGVVSEVPANRFEVVNANHSAGLGPNDVTGDPRSVGFFPCGPRFTDYYVANTGEGNVRTANYVGGVIGQNIDVAGVKILASWWSR
jgi:hypothetical protein